MNQGIIRALKAKYCSLAVCKLISALEKNERIPTISILSAMIVLGKAWNAVSNKAFTKCFKKAGISQNEVERVLDDKDSPFSNLGDIKEDSFQTLGADLAFLKERFVDQVHHNVILDDYININIEVSTMHGILIYQEIIAELNVVYKKILAMKKMNMKMVNLSQNKESKN